MELMHTLLLSMCGTGSTPWMLTASWIGMAVCAVLAVVHLARVASPGRDKLDIPSELCHAFMNFSMAYMFAPIASIKVIPDTLWALAFAVLALGFVIRALVYDQKQALGNAAHSFMNLSMTYMFLQASWDNTFVTGIFVLFFAAFATVHATQLLPGNGKAGGLTNFNAVFSSLSHVLMSAAMIFMFLMPALMPSGGSGHDHHQHHGAPSIEKPAGDSGHGHHHHNHGAPAQKPATDVQPKHDCPTDGQQGQPHKHHCH